jgi:hypothetical protein
MTMKLKEFFVHEASTFGGRFQPSAADPRADSPKPKQAPAEKPKEPEDVEKSWFKEHNDPTEPVDAGSTIWSDPSQPAKVRKFSSKGGQLHIDLKEIFGVEEMGGPGSGRKPGSKNKQAMGGVTPAKPADPESLPDDLDDFDIDVDDSAFASPTAKAAAAPPAAGSAGDDTFSRGDDDFGDDLSWLDDPALGQGVDVPKQGPPVPVEKEPRTDSGYSPEFDKDLEKYDFSEPEPKDKGQFWQDAGGEGAEAMDWNELKSVEPDIADDIGAEFPDIADSSAFFDINGDGDVVMRSQGSRYKWDSENAGWLPMDDGETPTGEF